MRYFAESGKSSLGHGLGPPSFPSDLIEADSGDDIAPDVYTPKATGPVSSLYRANSVPRTPDAPGDGYSGDALGVGGDREFSGTWEFRPEGNSGGPSGREDSPGSPSAQRWV